MNNKKEESTCVRLSKTEKQMLSVLKEKHCISVSALFRKFVQETYNRLENEDNTVNQK
jgi:hypothetical protein